MQRVQVIVAVLSLSLAAGGALGMAGERSDTLCIPLGTIVLQPPEDVEQTRASVEFSHSEHILFDEFSCVSCHHKWDGMGEILSCTASGCHDLTTKPPRGSRKASHRYLDYTEEALSYFEFAYHKQCLGCHREYREQGNEEAVMGCWRCHPTE